MLFLIKNHDNLIWLVILVVKGLVDSYVVTSNYGSITVKTFFMRLGIGVRIYGESSLETRWWRIKRYFYLDNKLLLITKDRLDLHENNIMHK